MCGNATNNCGQTVSCGTCDASATCQSGVCVANCVEDSDATTCATQFGCDYSVTNNCGRVVECGERCPGGFKFDCHCGPGACIYYEDLCEI